jgi:hypothetical protein
MSGTVASPRPSRASRAGVAGGRALEWLAPALAAVAEGAWVAAVYAVVQAASHVPAILGPAGMALAAGSGMVIARRWGPELGDRWPRTALALVGLAGAAGWIASPAVIARLLTLDLGGALAANPGGWLAGLAFLRGTAHARSVTSEATLERLVEWGLPGLVIPVLLAGMLPEPWRSEATSGVIAAVVVFLVSGTVGVAVARIAGMGSSGGFDWRRNRAWLALVGLLALGVVVAALPAAFLVGPFVRVAVALAFVPLLLVGVIAGLTQVSLRAVLGLLFAGILLLVLVAVAGPAKDQSQESPSGSGVESSEGDPTVVTFATGGVLAIVVVAGILILARLWMREALRPVDGDVEEERTIDADTPDTLTDRPRRRTSPLRATGPPADAASAYLALLHDIDGAAPVRRESAESPAEHARRLRHAGLGSPALDLLAADYELARFGGRDLSAREHARAIRRWQRLRRSLGH